MAPPIEGIEPFLFVVILDARFFPVGLHFTKGNAKPKVSCRWVSGGQVDRHPSRPRRRTRAKGNQYAASPAVWTGCRPRAPSATSNALGPPTGLGVGEADLQRVEPERGFAFGEVLALWTSRSAWPARQALGPPGLNA